MPRAHRHFQPHLVWHLTHRCHQREFLLKFARDRTRYLRWLFVARQRYALCVLDYMVTSNHVHLLVKDAGHGEIARSVQLLAARTAQQYNQRKQRSGAFWEDRYHATAIEQQSHLHRCLAYIDLNMVRAGVVKHPQQWAHSGYREIQDPPRRYRLIDLAALSELCGFHALHELQAAHRHWIAQALCGERHDRDPSWSESLAVGDECFVQRVKAGLGNRARYRGTVCSGQRWLLREVAPPYSVSFRGQK